MKGLPRESGGVRSGSLLGYLALKRSNDETVWRWSDVVEWETRDEGQFASTRRLQHFDFPRRDDAR